jgi:hypothetical protein
VLTNVPQIDYVLERYKSPGSDQIPAELIQAGGEILRSKIHKLINSIWNNIVTLYSFVD